MSIISQAIQYIGSLSMQIISFLGYGGITILMALESMVFPLPSELVMPFAGFLAATGKMSFILVVLFSSIGSLIGSLISYYIGLYGGNHLILKYGKYLLLDKEDLMKTEKWFRHSGEKTVFISRFIPVVRHIISIPAGIGRMHLWKFCIYTVAGATIWNTFLAWLGYLLGQNWTKVRHYSEYISIAVAIILVAAGAWFACRHIRHKLRKNPKYKAPKKKKRG